MATSYTGLRVQDTYNAIIKIGDNSNLTSTPKLLSDGLGNDSPLYLSGTRLGIGISPDFQFHTSGNAKIGGDVIISGNLTVNGTLTYLNVEDLAVEDPLIKLAKDNTANTLDIGLFGKYVATGTKYKGFFNDASDDKFKLFIGTTVEPTTTVDTSASGYTKGNLVIGNLEATDGDFSGTVYIDDHLEIENSSGYGYIELGGSSGGYIDLKGPFSNDFDLRVFTDGTNSQINAIAGALDITANSGIDLQYQGSNKLTVISTGIDVTGNLFVSGGIKDSDGDLGTSGQVLSSTATGTNWVDFQAETAKRTEILVKNVEGSSLVKGDPVYIVGSVGASERLEVGLCDSSDSSKMPCIGLLTQNLANNGEGTAIVTGKLKNLVTSPIDGVTPTENDTLFVKPGGSSGSALTTTKPTANNHLIQNVGQVGRVSTSSDGNIVVSAIMRTNDVPNQIDRDVNFTDDSELTFGNSSDLKIYHTTNNIVRINSGDLIFNSFVDDGDIKFQLDNGSDPVGLTEYMRLDGGVQRVIYSKSIQMVDDLKLYFGNDTSNDASIKWDSTASQLFIDGESKFLSDVTMTSSGLGNTPTLAIDNTASNSFIHSIEAFGANLTSGQTNIIVFGKEGNTKNSGYIGYNWDADASDTNYISLGHWNSDHLIRIYGTGEVTFINTITSTKDGIALQMDGGSSAEGIRMQADSSTTYPVFLRSVNPASGESSPWIYKENFTSWGIWHNNNTNSFDFTRQGSVTGAIETNVGGETNSVMIRLNNSDGSGTFVGNISGAAISGTTGTFTTIANATTDTDKFLVSDSGVIKYRTGAEVASDITTTLDGQYVKYNNTTQSTTSSVTIKLKNTTSAGYNEMQLLNDNDDRIVVGSIGSGYTGVDWQGATYVYNTGTSRKMYIKSQDELRFCSGGTSITANTALVLDTSQNATFAGSVGIGVTGTPSAKLHVEVPTAGASTLELKYGSGAAFQFQNGIANVTGDALVIKDTTNSYDYLTLRNGNVGIGVDSPAEKLHIRDASLNADVYIKIANDSRDWFMGVLGSNSDMLSFKTHDAANLLNITSGGNVIVGGTTIDTAGSVSFKNNGFIRSVLASGSADSTLINAIYGVSNGFQLINDASNNQSYIFYNGGTASLKIDTNGNVGIGKPNPDSPLVVYRTGDIWHTIIGNDTGQLRIGGQTSSGAVIQSMNQAGTSRDLYLQRDGGRIGIGTNNPNALLSLGNTGGQKLYVYESGVIRSGFGIDLSGSSRELSIFTTSSNGTTGNISFGYRLETDGSYVEKMRLSNSGDLTVESSIQWSGGVGRLISNQLQSGYNQNADNTDFWINYQGYQGGTTYFRDFRIGDGKQNQIAFFDGSTRNVGIGDTSPDYRLTVAKVNAATPAFMVSGAYYGGPRIQTYGLDSDPNAWMGLGTDMSGGPYEHNIYFSDTGTYGRLSMGTYNGTTYSEKMCVLRTGDVGIGTISPNDKLHVSSAGSDTYVRIGNNAGYDAGIYFNTSTDWTIGTDTSNSNAFTINNGSRVGSNSKIVIKTDGNVGIGKTNPDDAPLVVYRSGDVWHTVIGNDSGQIRFGGQTGSGAVIQSRTQSGTARDLYIQRDGGNVGININDAKTKLHIGPLSGGNATAQERLRLSGDYNGTGSGALLRFTNQHNSATNPNTGEYNLAGIIAYDFRSDWGGAIALQTAPNTSTGGTLVSRLVINPEGRVGIANSNPGYILDVTGDIRATSDVIAFSDKRVKENINTVDNALEKVSKLRGVTYTRKDIDDKSTKVGVIAQEVLDVLPEVVSQDDKGKYSVAYGNMAGVFIEAIKELKAEIEELKKCNCKCNCK